MAETKPTAKSDDDTPAKPPSRAAADPSRHASSTDPAVHKLLAERQTHESNLETLKAPADPAAVKAAEEAIAEVDRKLAEL